MKKSKRLTLIKILKEIRDANVKDEPSQNTKVLTLKEIEREYIERMKRKNSD